LNPGAETVSNFCHQAGWLYAEAPELAFAAAGNAQPRASDRAKIEVNAAIPRDRGGMYFPFRRPRLLHRRHARTGGQTRQERNGKAANGYRRSVPPASADALIVGAGVAGLTTALTLAEAGLRVRVWAADPPLATTSAAAGAMWAPYPSEPADRTLRWRTHSLDVLRRLAAQPRTGVRLATGIEAARTPISADVGDPASREFRVCESHELPSGFVAGFRITTPLIDMPVYLRHLERMLADAGTVIEPRRLRSLSQAAGAAATIVNCAGTGARTLVPDESVTAIRGQVVVVENPGLTEFFAEISGQLTEQCYIYPHGETAVLGGVAMPDQWGLDPDEAIASGILSRCCAVEPALRGARVIGHRVGLRPGRPEVRLEEEEIEGFRLIHNYGHGHAGVTLSWGCAADVRALVLCRD